MTGRGPGEPVAIAVSRSQTSRRHLELTSSMSGGGVVVRQNRRASFSSCHLDYNNCARMRWESLNVSSREGGATTQPEILDEPRGVRRLPILVDQVPRPILPSFPKIQAGLMPHRPSRGGHRYRL